MQFVRKRRRQPFINIISLIDILVVLLIFYIATTVFKHTEPKINIVVPPSTTAKSTGESPPSTIYVTADGKLFFDDAPVEPEKLAGLLEDKQVANPKFQVAMKADEHAPFGAIVKVMDAANEAHIVNLSTYTDKKPAASSSP